MARAVEPPRDSRGLEVLSRGRRSSGRRCEAAAQRWIPTPLSIAVPAVGEGHRVRSRRGRGAGGMPLANHPAGRSPIRTRDRTARAGPPPSDSSRIRGARRPACRRRSVRRPTGRSSPPACVATCLRRTDRRKPAATLVSSAAFSPSLSRWPPCPRPRRCRRTSSARPRPSPRIPCSRPGRDGWPRSHRPGRRRAGVR